MTRRRGEYLHAVTNGENVKLAVVAVLSANVPDNSIGGYSDKVMEMVEDGNFRLLWYME